jgi:ribosomal protein S18 acetylase RimI-like enzyme
MEPIKQVNYPLLSKQAFLASAIGGANRLLQTGLGANFMSLDNLRLMGLPVVLKKTTNAFGNTAFKAKSHVFEDPTWTKFMGNKPRIPLGPIQKPVQSIADTLYNNRSKELKQKIDVGSKYWHRASNIAMGVTLGDMVLNSAKPSEVAKLPSTTQVASMRPIGSPPIGSKANTFQVPPPNVNKEASFLELTPASVLDLPRVIEESLKLKHEFMLNTPKAIQLLIKNIVEQDTMLLGDSSKLVAFFNGGDRGLPNIDPKAYYIRLVWVNPKNKGQGLAKSILTTVMEKQSAKGKNNFWMQICPDNTVMQKCATSLGFNHITSYYIDGNESQVWYK